MTSDVTAHTAAERAAATGRGRRELGIAVLGCLLGAAVVLVSVGATWVRLRVSAVAGAGGSAGGVAGYRPLPGFVAAPLAVRLTGGTLTPAATGLGLVGLAGVVAIAATRRLGRVVVGVLVLAAGAGVMVVAGQVLVNPASAARGTSQVRQIVPDGPAVVSSVVMTAGPWLACFGGLLLAVSGLLVAARGRRWSALSARYSAPATRPVTDWDAIERGDDPT